MCLSIGGRHTLYTRESMEVQGQIDARIKSSKLINVKDVYDELKTDVQTMYSYRIRGNLKGYCNQQHARAD